MSLSKVEGGKKKLIVTKVVKVKDYTQEISLGSAGGQLVGGKGFPENRLERYRHQGQGNAVSRRRGEP